MHSFLHVNYIVYKFIYYIWMKLFIRFFVRIVRETNTCWQYYIYNTITIITECTKCVVTPWFNWDVPNPSQFKHDKNMPTVFAKQVFTVKIWMHWLQILSNTTESVIDIISAWEVIFWGIIMYDGTIATEIWTHPHPILIYVYFLSMKTLPIFIIAGWKPYRFIDCSYCWPIHLYY